MEQHYKVRKIERETFFVPKSFARFELLDSEVYGSWKLFRLRNFPQKIVAEFIFLVISNANF